MTEKQFQQQVSDLARLCKWRIYHTHDSRRSNAGFPDLVMVRGAMLIFAELKTDAKASKLTPAQKEWIDALRLVEGYAMKPFQDFTQERPISVYVWRPSNWDGIVEALR